MVWCPRQAKCEWCKQPITVATPSVNVLYWNKTSDGRRWNVKKYYHPNCWLASGTDYLNLHPYYAGERRGPKPKLTAEDAGKRLRLLRRKATLEQRKKLLNTTRPDYLSALISLEIKVLDTIMEIAPLGGVPKKWMEKL